MCESVTSTASAERHSDVDAMTSDEDNMEDNDECDSSDTASAPSPRPQPRPEHGPTSGGAAGDSKDAAVTSQASSAPGSGKEKSLGDQHLLQPQNRARTSSNPPLPPFLPHHMASSMQRGSECGYDSAATLSADEGPGGGDTAHSQLSPHVRLTSQRPPHASTQSSGEQGRSSFAPAPTSTATRPFMSYRPHDEAVRMERKQFTQDGDPKQGYYSFFRVHMFIIISFRF